MLKSVKSDVAMGDSSVLYELYRRRGLQIRLHPAEGEHFTVCVLYAALSLLMEWRRTRDAPHRRSAPFRGQWYSGKLQKIFKLCQIGHDNSRVSQRVSS